MQIVRYWREQPYRYQIRIITCPHCGENYRDVGQPECPSCQKNKGLLKQPNRLYLQPTPSLAKV